MGLGWPLIFYKIIFLTIKLVSFYDASMLTNRDLERVFSKSLVQVKRWALAALGSDPEAPQAGGISRLYSNDEVFIIFLFGKVFIEELRMNSEEAKGHINIIKTILFKEGILPSKIDLAKWFIPTGLTKRFETFSLMNDKFNSLPLIYLTVLPNSYYLIEWKIKCLFPVDSSQDGSYSTTLSYEKIYQGDTSSKTGLKGPISLISKIEDFNNLIK